MNFLVLFKKIPRNKVLAFFFFFFCSFSIVVWGVLTQKKPFAGKLCVILDFFFLFPIDKLLRSQILITSLSLPLSYIVKSEPVLLQEPLSAHFCFCWSLLHSSRSVCGLHRLLICWQSQLGRQLCCYSEAASLWRGSVVYL